MYSRSDVLELTLGGATSSVAATVTSPPTTIKQGDTFDQVEAALGEPAQRFILGAKEIYIYDVPPMRIVFRDGKVIDIQ
jgi:hypothetical protein